MHVQRWQIVVAFQLLDRGFDHGCGGSAAEAAKFHDRGNYIFRLVRRNIADEPGIVTLLELRDAVDNHRVMYGCGAGFPRHHDVHPKGCTGGSAAAVDHFKEALPHQRQRGDIQRDVKSRGIVRLNQPWRHAVRRRAQQRGVGVGQLEWRHLDRPLPDSQ